MLNAAMTVAVNDSTTGPEYLGRLNADQRRAVMHGYGEVAAPLLDALLEADRHHGWPI